MLIVASTLLALWGYTSLEVVLRLAVLKHLAAVQLAGLMLKVLFHHIKVVLIVLLIHTRITPYQDTELVKRLSNELALLIHLNWVLLEEGLHINNGYVS
jgi:hypothetical protein